MSGSAFDDATQMLFDTRSDTDCEIPSAFQACAATNFLFSLSAAHRQHLLVKIGRDGGLFYDRP
jgi:hypothetical protein